MYSEVTKEIAQERGWEHSVTFYPCTSPPPWSKRTVFGNEKVGRYWHDRQLSPSDIAHGKASDAVHTDAVVDVLEVNLFLRRQRKDGGMPDALDLGFCVIH